MNQDAERRRDAKLRLLIADLAVRCYEAERGDSPSDLNQLVPEYLDAVPMDPYSGKPVIYRLSQPGKWTVYSVSRDGEDDGGKFASEYGGPGSDLDLDTTMDWLTVSNASG